MVDGRTRTGKIINSLKTKVPQISGKNVEVKQDFGGMFIPNHSGISNHPEAKKAFYSADKIGDGTSSGQILYWNGSAWTPYTLLTGVDNSVLIKDSDGLIKTDEIDSRVWGSTLVDATGTTGRYSYFLDSNTLGNSNLIHDSILGCSYFTGSLAGFPEGEMYNYNSAVSVTIATANTWTAIPSGFSSGKLNCFTFRDPDMTVGKDGLYLITWKLAFKASESRVIGATVIVNGNTKTKGANRATEMAHPTGEEPDIWTALAGSCILNLSATDTLSLAVINYTDDSDIQVIDMGVTATHIGGV